jgi:hypothetical protein
MEEENKDIVKKGKNYVCVKCNYETKYKSSYEKHINTEKHKTGKHKTRSDKKDNRCDICRYELSSQRAMNKHKINKHS